MLELLKAGFFFICPLAEKKKVASDSNNIVPRCHYSYDVDSTFFI